MAILNLFDMIKKLGGFITISEVVQNSTKIVSNQI